MKPSNKAIELAIEILEDAMSGFEGYIKLHPKDTDTLDGTYENLIKDIESVTEYLKE